MDRLQRLLDLVHVLRQSKAPVPLETLRAHFVDYRGENEQSTRRKFERDKAELSKLGLTLRYVSDEEAGDGYVLDDDAFLPEIALELPEYALLGAAARAALSDRSFPFPVALRLALAKLDADHGDEADASFRLTTFASTDAYTGGDAAESRGVLEALSDALVRRKRVHLRYRRPADRHAPEGTSVSADGSLTTTGFVESERDVDPYGISLRRGAWYLVGHDHHSSSIRVFRVNRVTAIEVNPSKPGSPDFELPEDFALDSVLAVSPLGFPLHAPERVVVEVDRDVAFMMERRWGAPTGDATRERVRFEFETSNVDYVVDHVLELGRHAVLLEPPRGRALLRESYAAIVAAHERLDTDREGQR